MSKSFRWLAGVVIVVGFLSAAPAQNAVWLSYSNAGAKAFEAEKWEEAARYYQLAVEEGERLGWTNEAMAESLHNFAASLSNQGKHKEALPYATRASRLYGKVVSGYQDSNLRSANLLTNIYWYLERFEDAIPFLEWAAEGIEKSGRQTENLPWTFYKLGYCRYRTGATDKTDEPFRQARRLYRGLGNLTGEADCVRGLALAAQDRKEIENAVELFKEASALYLRDSRKNKVSVDYLMDCLETASKLLEANKKPEEADRLRRQLEEDLADLGSTGRRILASRFYDRAWEQNRNRKYQEAEKTIRSAIEQFDLIGEENRLIPYAHGLHGRLLARLGRPDDAVVAFRAATRAASEITDPSDYDTGWAYKEYGDFEYGRHAYSAARPLYEKALAAAEKHDDAENSRLRRSLSDLVWTYTALELWNEAKPTNQRLMETIEKLKGEESVDLVDSLYQMARIEEKLGRKFSAERNLKRALAIRQKNDQPGDPELFTAISKLARLYQHDERPDAAEKLLRSTLEEWETALGAQSVKLAPALNGMANFLASVGKYDEAEKLYKRVLANAELANGPDHRTVADALSVLADFYHELGRQSEAEPLFKRALAIYEATDGNRSRAVSDTLNSLSWVHIRQGRYEDGVPLARRSLSILEELGENPATLARGYTTLGCLLMDLEKYTEAEPLLRKALKLYEQNDDNDRLGQAAVLHNLGILCSGTDRPDESLELHRRSVTLREKAGIDDVVDLNTKLNRAGNMARSYFGLAGRLSEFGERTEAEEYARKSAEVIEKYLGSEHPEMVAVLSRLAQFAAARGAYTEREALYARAAALRSKLYSTDIALARNQTEAALVHWHHGRLTDADAAYRKAETAYAKKYDQDPAHLAWIWKRRGQLLSELGRFEEAGKLLTKTVDYYAEAYPESTSYAGALLQLADHEYATGDFDKAEKHETEAIRIYEKVYGKDSKSTRTLTYRKASADMRAGRYSDARGKYEQLLATAAKDWPDSPDHMTALQSKAHLDLLEGAYPAARKVLAAARVLAEKFHGNDAYHLAELRDQIAEVHLRSGKPAEAIEPAQQAYAAFGDRLGADHPTTTAAGLRLARALAANGESAKAAELLDKVVPVRNQLYSADHPATAETRLAEAEVAAAAGKANDAFKHFADAVRIRDLRHPHDHPETRRILTLYLAALDKADNDAQATVIRKRLNSVSEPSRK